MKMDGIEEYKRSNNRRLRGLGHLFFISFILLYYFTNPSGPLLKTVIIAIVESVLVILTAITYDSYRKSEKYVISPMFLWLLLWCLPIIVARLYIPSLYSDLIGNWNKKTLVFVTLNTICFYFIFSLVSSSKFSLKSKKQDYRIDYEYLSIFVIILLDVGIISYLLNVIYVGFVPLLTQSPDTVKDSFVTTPFFSINNVSRVAYIYLLICLRNTRSRKKRRHMIISALIGIVLLLLTSYRAYLFQVFFFVIASLRSTKEKNYKYLFLAAVIGFFMFAGVAVIRERLLRSSNTLLIALLLRTGFRYVYLYIYPSFTNLQIVINSFKPNYSFIYTSEMFWGIFLSPNQINGFSNLYSGFGTFNVGTYLLQPYGDYGLVGTLFWTFLIAFFASVSYKVVSKHESLLALTFLGISYEVIFYMHNSFVLRSSSELMFIVIAVVLSVLCRRAESQRYSGRRKLQNTEMQ